MKHLREELLFLEKLVKDTGKIILQYYQQGLQVEYKKDSSPVTIADKKAEEFIRNSLEKYTPNYGIIGEEFPPKIGTHMRQWTVDPIDGTKSFICGLPLFSILISLMEEGKAIVGIVYFPALDLTLSAIDKQGSFVNELPCRVSKVTTVEESILLDGSITTLESKGYGDVWRKLRQQCKFHRGWGDAYGYFLVATGKAEVMFDPVAEIWDLAPMSVIITEAGGVFSSAKNGDFIGDRSGVATNGYMHSTILKALSALS